MKHTDIHDARKAQIEDNAIRRSELEHEEKVAMFGKVAYEGYQTKCGFKTFDWPHLPEQTQCAFVAAAQAVLDEARKAGWFK